MHHVHESPPVMTVPLMRAGGGCRAGRLARPRHDRPEGEFWAGAIFYGEHNHVLHAMHEVPFWVKLAPMLAMVGGLGLSYVLLHRPRPAWGPGSRRRPAALPAVLQQVVLRRALRLPVRPPGQGAGLGALARRRRRASSTGSGRTASRAATLRTRQRAVQLQTGYVYHYAFVMLIGVAVLVSWYLLRDCRAEAMGDWPLLSLVTFLPLVGRGVHPASSAATRRSWPATAGPWRCGRRS